MNHKKFLILFSSSRVSFWKSWMFGKYKKLILQPQLPDSAAKLILGVKWLTNTRNWTLKLKSSTSTLWHLALGVKWLRNMWKHFKNWHFWKKIKYLVKKSGNSLSENADFGLPWFSDWWSKSTCEYLLEGRVQ